MSFFSGVSVDPSESCFFVGGVGLASDRGVERKCTSLLITRPLLAFDHAVEAPARWRPPSTRPPPRHRAEARSTRYSGGRSLFGSFDKKREPRARVNKGFALVSMFESQKPSTRGVTFCEISIPRSFFN